MKKIFLSLGFLFALGLQVATAQTWEDAYAVPNMLGDGGLLQPNSIDNNNFTIYNFQQHATKICENNSVIPRDRIGFHFDSLQTVQTGIDNSAGLTVPRYRNIQEYRFWGEKTFLDENISLDLIVPVYYSTDPSIDTFEQALNPTPLAGQFGDLAFGLKALVWEDAEQAYSAGVRVEAPTGPEFSVRGLNPAPGVDQNLLDLDAWYFTPWIGGQWTPGTNWFASAFVSYRLNSGPVLNRLNNGTDLNVRQATYLFADLAIGRWIVQREGQGGLTSLAPVLELHYTTTPTAASAVNSFDFGYQTGRVGKTDYLNITGGLNGTYNDVWQFGIGGALPMRTGSFAGLYDSDRTFSWALLANLNYYFR
ncbi:MAG: hypothetical protein CMJ74_10320 [Planctomycetaceae bacterium]|nr:hypothetical protein [Planctomycetaceae bacterium]